MNPTAPILVTGATGYVGGRLIPRLLAAGHAVRAMGRDTAALARRSWAAHPKATLVRADILDYAALEAAVQGCRACYYLIHAMISGKGDFAEADKQAARHMVAAAARAGLERIIYLGGLGEARHPGLSPHLASRHEVGRLLQSGPVPCTVLRAAMIIGSGSASFEILRYLVERLPLMITPKWVRTPTQPIAIGNVLDYLTGCLDNAQVLGKTFDIGGPDILSYRDLIHLYAEEKRLPKRWVVSAPVLTPRLSAYWIHLVTPVPAAIAMPLTQGLSAPTTCRETSIRRLLPLALTPCRQAIQTALQQVLQKQVETCWSEDNRRQPPEWATRGDADYAGGLLLTCGYQIALDQRPDRVWPVLRQFGGAKGYLFAHGLWRLRGLLDRIVGGPGLARSRTDPDALSAGARFDYWRVLSMTPYARLVLLSEMRLPGDGILDFRLFDSGSGRAVVQVFARFAPRGLGGILYWYALLPFHRWVFRGLLRRLAKHSGSAVRRLEALAVAPPPPQCEPEDSESGAAGGLQ